MLFTRFRQAWADRSGAAMVEAALVVPLLILIFASIGQFGFLFAVNSNMVDVARETVRRIAVCEFATSGEAETYASGRLLYPLTYGATATMITDPFDDVSITITAPMAEVAFLDIVGVFGGGNLSNTVTMRSEC